MWTSPEDGERYRELSRAIHATLKANDGQGKRERVKPEELAAFLEWLGLAREVAPTLRPFVEASSPHALERFSYLQMLLYFRYLSSQITVSGEPAEADG
jgi:hypothetical protein